MKFYIFCPKEGERRKKFAWFPIWLDRPFAIVWLEYYFWEWKNDPYAEAGERWTKYRYQE